MLAVTSETIREGVTFSIIQATLYTPVSKYVGHELGDESKLISSLKPQSSPFTSFWVQFPIIKGLLESYTTFVVLIVILSGLIGLTGGLNVFTVHVTILI